MVDQGKLLRFLQKYKFDLMREIPGFLDMTISEDGTKILLSVSAPLKDPLPTPEFEDEQIPLELAIKQPNSGQPVVVTNPMVPESLPKMPEQEDQIGTVLIPEKVAIGPNESGARESTAFEAWQKRHSHIKPKG